MDLRVGQFQFALGIVSMSHRLETSSMILISKNSRSSLAVIELRHQAAIKNFPVMGRSGQ